MVFLFNPTGDFGSAVATKNATWPFTSDKRRPPTRDDLGQLDVIQVGKSCDNPAMITWSIGIDRWDRYQTGYSTKPRARPFRGFHAAWQTPTMLTSNKNRDKINEADDLADICHTSHGHFMTSAYSEYAKVTILGCQSPGKDPPHRGQD